MEKVQENDGFEEDEEYNEDEFEKEDDEVKIFFRHACLNATRNF